MAKELGLTGGVTIYAENILEDNFEILNEPWATVVVEHNIVFQGKTSNSLSGVYNEALELVGVTINRIDNALILPQTPVTMVTGTLDNDTKTRLDTVDLSGANVTEVSVDDLGRD
jgi:ACT domain-containing protein